MNIIEVINAIKADPEMSESFGFLVKAFPLLVVILSLQTLFVWVPRRNKRTTIGNFFTFSIVFSRICSIFMFVKMYKETKGTEELPMAILAIAYFVVAFLLNYVLAILLYKFVKAVNNYGTSSPSANTGNSRNLNEAQLEAEWQMVLADIKAMGWVVNFSKPISWAEWMVCKKSIMEAEMRKQQERQHWQEEERKREQQRKEQEYARQQTTNIPKEQDFFAGCNTLDDIKARYKLLMRAYHPDTGIGDIETCQIINAQYDLRCQQYSQN